LVLKDNSKYRLYDIPRVPESPSLVASTIFDFSLGTAAHTGNSSDPKKYLGEYWHDDIFTASTVLREREEVVAWEWEHPGWDYENKGLWEEQYEVYVSTGNFEFHPDYHWLSSAGWELQHGVLVRSCTVSRNVEVENEEEEKEDEEQESEDEDEELEDNNEESDEDSDVLFGNGEESDEDE
jgi:hypothetical protein